MQQHKLVLVVFQGFDLQVLRVERFVTFSVFGVYNQCII